MITDDFLFKYFKQQKENAKLINRIKFVVRERKYLTLKERIKYLFKYSPSINQLPLGAALAEGLRKGLEME